MYPARLDPDRLSKLTHESGEQAPARLELLPPVLLERLLSKLTYDELARANCVSKTLCEACSLSAQEYPGFKGFE